MLRASYPARLYGSLAQLSGLSCPPILACQGGWQDGRAIALSVLCYLVPSVVLNDISVIVSGFITEASLACWLSCLSYWAKHLGCDAWLFPLATQLAYACPAARLVCLVTWRCKSVKLFSLAALLS